MACHTSAHHCVWLGPHSARPGFLCVFKEEFIEIAEPEQQKRICGDAPSEPPILLHHWSERVPHDSRIKSRRTNCEFELSKAPQCRRGIRGRKSALRWNVQIFESSQGLRRISSKNQPMQQ